MILLDKNKKVPMYEQLFLELRRDILSGELEQDTKLKPIRVLAEKLNVSNNTVNRAYQQLLSEGYIKAVQGSGYYVEELHAYEEHETVDSSVPKSLPKSTRRTRIQYDFCYESIESDTFPWSKWRRYMQNAMVEESYNASIAYECNKGNLELRQSLCEYINTSRGVKCTPDQIILCAGTQYGMDIITNILPKKKYQVAVEEPGYNAMRKIFSNKGYKITSFPMKKNGIDANLVEKSNCNLLYLTPSHQFPTGFTTSLEKRVQLLEWSRRNNHYIIENDYDNEFFYGRRPLPSMQALDRGGRVIYLSTLSKVLSPSLRCAYAVLPQSLLEIYEEKYKCYYSALPTYNQRALAAFINDGHLERHVRKMSMLNQRKAEIFHRVMEELLPEELYCYPTAAGTHFLVRIPACTNQGEFIEKMKRRGIRIYGTKKYWYNKGDAPENIFLFGFNAIYEEDLEEACRAFAVALKGIINK